jgi:hypothetical protein
MLRPVLRSAALAVALCWTSTGALPAAAETLPRLEADALGGTHVVLPADAAGKPLIILLAFTRESESDMKSWSRRLLEDHIAENAVVYVVVVADKTVFFSHHHIRSIVESSAIGTKAQIESNVLVTFDGTGWRQLVPPGDKKTAGIVVCDPGGDIVYAKREPFSDANLADVEKAAK